jgi:hypothetical protein
MLYWDLPCHTPIPQPWLARGTQTQPKNKHFLSTHPPTIHSSWCTCDCCQFTWATLWGLAWGTRIQQTRIFCPLTIHSSIHPSWCIGDCGWFTLATCKVTSKNNKMQCHKQTCYIKPTCESFLKDLPTYLPTYLRQLLLPHKNNKQQLLDVWLVTTNDNH